MPKNTLYKPDLRPVTMGLFPVKETLQEVVEVGEAQLPIINKNDLHVLLMTYHNTLLKELKK